MGRESKQKSAIEKARHVERKFEDSGESPWTEDFRRHIESAEKPFTLPESSDSELRALLSRGDSLLGQGQPDQALAVFYQAVERAEKTRQRLAQVTSLTRLGSAYEQLGAFPESLASLQRALTITRRIGDRFAEGRCRLSRCAISYELERYDHTITEGRRVIRIAHKIGDKVAEQSAYGILGNAARHMSRTEEAIECYAASRRISDDLHDERHAAIALNNLGRLYEELGRLSEAVECLSESVPMLSSGEDIRGAISGQLALASALRALGKPHEALHHAMQARDFATQFAPGVPAALGTISNTLGYIYRSLGLYEVSVEQLSKARSIAQLMEDLQAQGAVSNNLGLTYLEMHENLEAVTFLREALEIANQLNITEAQVASENNLTSALLALGDSEEAEQSATRALLAAQSIGHMAGECVALNNLVVAEFMRGSFNEAEIHCLESLRVMERYGFHGLELSIRSNLAKVRDATGRTTAAIDEYERALESLETLRLAVLSDELRATFFTTAAKLPLDYARLLLRSGRSRDALHVIERGRARSFLDLLERSLAAEQPAGDAVLVEREQKLLGELRSLRQLIDGSQAGQQDVDKALRHRVHQIELDLHSLYIEKHGIGLRDQVLDRLQIWKPAQLQSDLLNSGTVLLEYSLDEPESVLFVLTDDRFEVYSLPGQDVLEQMVIALRSAVLRGENSYPYGHELYQALVAPAFELIRERRLIIIPDGALHYLPFALLLTAPMETPHGVLSLAEFPYLIREHSISYAPSATVAGILHTK
ncbi:tetratricopeptide repeat protein, partial [Streptomyces sp. NPDC005859]|uniref:CHAT domain-containing protein n=1 Tax=Streptomyces sp. NPDC005859 TaxID=3157170 RepID=UPI0033E03F48